MLDPPPGEPGSPSLTTPTVAASGVAGAATGGGQPFARSCSAGRRSESGWCPGSGRRTPRSGSGRSSAPSHSRPRRRVGWRRERRPRPRRSGRRRRLTRGGPGALGRARVAARWRGLNRPSRWRALDSRSRWRTLNRRSRWRTLNRRSRWRTLNRRSRWRTLNRRSRWRTLNRRSRWRTLDSRCRGRVLSRRAVLGGLSRGTGGSLGHRRIRGRFRSRSGGGRADAGSRGDAGLTAARLIGARPRRPAEDGDEQRNRQEKSG